MSTVAKQDDRLIFASLDELIAEMEQGAVRRPSPLDVRKDYSYLTCQAWLKLVPKLREENPPTGGDTFHRWLADFCAREIGKSLLQRDDLGRNKKISVQWYDVCISNYVVMARWLERRLPGCTQPAVPISLTKPFR